MMDKDDRMDKHINDYFDDFRVTFMTKRCDNKIS